MNDKLENCLYKSGLTAQGCWDELDDYAKQGIEKFAELVILECARVVKASSPQGMIGVNAIRIHFGFEP